MGTRALITIETGSKNQKSPSLKIYKHWDGYLESLGTIIFAFLSKVQFSNGMVESGENIVMCNGADEFAAKLLTYLKDLYSDGDVYLADLEASGSDLGAEYAYTISICNENLNNPVVCEIDEIKVNAIRISRSRQIFKHAEGGQDKIISEFGAFLHKEYSKSTPMAEVLRTQALCDTITKGMIVRNITQVLLSEAINNKSLVEFQFSTMNGPLYEKRPKTPLGLIKIPVVTDELAYAATEITPNNIVSSLEIGVELIETDVKSNQYRVKKIVHITALCKSPDPSSKASYSYSLHGIKLNACDLYATLLNADGSGKELTLEVGTDSEVIQAKFATSNPATAKQMKQDEMALF